MNLKISTDLSVEMAQDLNGKIHLLGNDKISDVIRGAAIAGRTFVEVYGYTNQFFYNASIVVNGQRTCYEVGIGHLEPDNFEGLNDILVRDRPLYQGRPDKGLSPATQLMSCECTSEGETLLICSHRPSDNSELLYKPYTIVTCEEPHVPTSVEFSKIDTLPDFCEGIKKALCKVTKLISLKCSRLDVKKIKTPQITISPSTKPDHKAGTLYYDVDTNQLRCYDGSRWRTLVYEDT